MIERQWRGLAKSEFANRYVEHLQQETFPELNRIRGFVSASILRRSRGPETEFLIVTRWQSMNAVEQFAGRDPDVAVVPEKVQEMMVEYDRTVRYYEIVQ